MANCNNCGSIVKDGMWFCNEKCRNENRIKFKPKKTGEELR